MALVTIAWGGTGDIAAPGDFDGDGETDVAIVRPSTGEWFIRQSSTRTMARIVWGLGSDIPVPGDFDGDGLTDVAIVRPATGTWYIRRSSTLTLDALPGAPAATSQRRNSHDARGDAERTPAALAFGVIGGLATAARAQQIRVFHAFNGGPEASVQCVENRCFRNTSRV